MSQQQQQRQRLCGYCKLPGHNIASCQDQSIALLKRDLQNAGDFCIAYGSPRYLKAWLFQCTIPKLRVLLGSTPTAVPTPAPTVPVAARITLKDQYCIELKNIYYTNRLQEPGIKERLREQLPQEVVADIRQIIAQWLSIGIIHMTLGERHHLSDRRDENRIHEIDRAMSDIRRQYDRLDQEREALIYAMSERQLELDEQEKNRHPRKFNIETKLVQNQEQQEQQQQEQQQQEQKNDDKCDCPICYDSIPKKDMITTNCEHDYCGICLTNYFDSLAVTKVPSCPLCRKQITQLQFKNEILFNDIREKYIDLVAARAVEAVEAAVEVAVEVDAEEPIVMWTIERTIQALFQ